jgi:hypothetical protein
LSLIILFKVQNFLLKFVLFIAFLHPFLPQNILLCRLCLPVRTAPPSLTSEESAQQHPSSSTLVTGDRLRPVLDSAVEDSPRLTSPSVVVAEDSPRPTSPSVVVAEDSPQPSPPPIPLIIPQQPPNAALLPTPTSPTHDDPTPPTSDPERCTVVSPSVTISPFWPCFWPSSFFFSHQVHT